MTDEPVMHGHDGDAENRALYLDILARAGIEGRDARLLTKLTEEMVASSLISQLDSKLSSEFAKIATMLGAFEVRLDARMGGLEQSIERLNVKVSELDKRIEVVDTKVVGLESQFGWVKWMVITAYSFVTAVAVTFFILQAMSIA